MGVRSKLHSSVLNRELFGAVNLFQMVKSPARCAIRLAAPLLMGYSMGTTDIEPVAHREEKSSSAPSGAGPPEPAKQSAIWHQHPRT